MASGIPAGNAYVIFGANTKPLFSAITAVNRRLRSMGRSVSAAGDQLAKIGAGAAVGFGLAGIVGAQFADKIAEAGLTTNATADQFDTLKDKAKELGRTTSFTAAEVAAGMAEIGRSTGSVDAALTAIEGTLNVARASGQTIAESAQLIQVTANAFDTADFKRVGDVLVATANNSAQNIFDLSESMKIAAKEGKSLDLSLEDTAKVLGVMAQGAQRGSMAGTGLRAMFTQLAKTDVQDRLAELGVAVKDMSGNVRSPIAMLKDLQKQIAKFDKLTQKGILTELFDVRGASAALSIMGVSQEKIDAVTNAVDNSTGIAERFAKVMDQTLGGSFRLLVSAAQGVGIEIAEAIDKPLRAMIDTVARVSSGIAQFVQQNPELIQKALVLTTTILGLAAAFKVAGIALIAFGTLFSPLGLVILAIGGVILAFSDTTAKALGADALGLVDFVSNFKIAGISIGGYLKIWENEFQYTMATLAFNMQDTWRFIFGVISSIPNMFKAIWYRVLYEASSVFADLGRVVWDTVNSIKSVLYDLLSYIPLVGAELSGLQAEFEASRKAEVKFVWDGIRDDAAENLTKITNEQIKKRDDIFRQINGNTKALEAMREGIDKDNVLILRDDQKKTASQDILAKKLAELNAAIGGLGIKQRENDVPAATASGEKAGKVEEVKAAAKKAAEVSSRVSGSFAGAAAFAVRGSFAKAGDKALQIAKEQVNETKNVVKAIKENYSGFPYAVEG